MAKKFIENIASTDIQGASFKNNSTASIVNIGVADADDDSGVFEFSLDYNQLQLLIDLFDKISE